ncbi:MAG: transglycosylase domain-containing protein, partial [Gammaproteobacteria bacterium]
MKRRHRTARKNRKKRVLRFMSLLLIVLLLASLLPVLALRWVTPPTSAVMLQRTLTEDRQQTWEWTDIEHMSAHIALAVVASEDQKFPQHHGFDLQSIQAAIQQNTRGRRMRGAST